MYFRIRYYGAFSTFSLDICSQIESCTYHMCVSPPPPYNMLTGIVCMAAPPPPQRVFAWRINCCPSLMSVILPAAIRLWCCRPDKHILDSCICLLIQVNLGHISLAVLNRNTFTPVLTYPVNIVHEHNYFCKIQCMILWCTARMLKFHKDKKFIQYRCYWVCNRKDQTEWNKRMKSMKAKLTFRLQ